jgi:hypothetical protein
VTEAYDWERHAAAQEQRMQDLEREYGLAREHEERYRNALLWVRTIAGMHYLGGAFEPEHMRDLANLAANALTGRDLADFEESAVKARKKAAKWAERFGRELAEQGAEE